MSGSEAAGKAPRAGLARAGLLLASSHPEPAAAVTTVATALAASAGRSAWGVVAVAVAVAAGQLSVGWCNDYVDRDRDAAAGRRDKPVARGDISPGLVRWAAGIALVAVRAAVAARPDGGRPWCTSPRSPWPGATTCASNRPHGRWSRTPSRSACCRSSSCSGCPARPCRRGGRRSPGRCSGRVRTSRTRCPILLTTWRRECGACRIGVGARASRILVGGAAAGASAVLGLRSRASGVGDFGRAARGGARRQRQRWC